MFTASLCRRYSPKMKWVVIYFHLIFAELVADSKQISKQQEIVFNNEGEASVPLPLDRSSLSVLLLSVPSSGHLSPVLALGEELARRGYNVTLCLSNDSNFSEKIRNRIIQVGVRFLATGQSNLKTAMRENVGTGAVPFEVLRKLPSVLGNEAEIILSFLDTFVKQNKVDVIVGEEFLSVALACASFRYQIPTIFMSSTLQVMPYTYPPWPWPGQASGSVSDNLMFLQRLWIPLERLVVSVLLNYAFLPPQLDKIKHFCNNRSHSYFSSAPSTHLPQIIPSSIGLEYPRTISSLTHYVGPVLTKSPDPLPANLEVWLKEKENNSVIFISMGSHMHLSERMGATIINSIAKTNYSAVWTLINSDTLLEGQEIDQNRFFITNWVPQLSVLGNGAIRMAILHGGANGIHEALYNEVPIIVLPHFGDQMYLAGRVYHNNLGVYIPSTELSVSSISAAIKQIDDNISYYHLNIERLKRIFIQAGGVERAADLVEYYEAVGCSHLVPAYAKYNWNFVQYYNIDVYLLLSILLSLFLYVCCSLCKCALRRFIYMSYHRKLKME